MKNILVISIMLQVLAGQTALDRVPYSSNHDLDNNLEKIILESVDVEVLLNEDLSRPSGTPYRYGYIHRGEFSPKNSGLWTKLDDGGLLWQIYFKSIDAYAISLEYSQFFIPEGGELYVYNPGYEIVYGAYTHLNNSKSFATPHVVGDEIIIEYYQPADVEGKFDLMIVEIIHDYRDIMNYSGNQRDWECGINVICETDENYQGAINSVAFLDMGGFICSGAMVNNVRQDLTPYFLTAWHCIDGDNPNTFRFYFEKEASSCENTWASLGEYAYSSNLVADSDGISHSSESESPGGDWALLLINDEIEDDWEVFYAGWDITVDHPSISCGIHHPGGTGKKINYDDDIAYGAWWDNASHGLTHWQVNWDEGGSEGGSSGSPLFNDNFQIVGVLTGGAGVCGDGFPDLYGKLSYGWNWEMESNRRLIDWLDPDYTGTVSINGIYTEVIGIAGDLNSDEEVNILDIIALANLILEDEVTNEELDLADLNGDENLNILDIISLVNIILIINS